MKKFLVCIFAAVLALASCSKDTMSYSYKIHYDFPSGSSYVYMLQVNEYNEAGIRVNSYQEGPCRQGDVFKRRSANGADRITMGVFFRSGSTTSDMMWVSSVGVLKSTRDFTITGTTMVQKYEPAVR